MRYNEFESIVLDYLKDFTDLIFDPSNVIQYQNSFENVESDSLFVDVPTKNNKRTEFVFASKKHSMRIECKYQKSKYNLITRNSIIGILKACYR